LQDPRRTRVISSPSLSGQLRVHRFVSSFTAGRVRLAAYAGTAFAVSWKGQKEAEQAPVMPAAHLLVTLIVSLAGAATVMAIAGQI
jgi:hypothetical protein